MYEGYTPFSVMAGLVPAIHADPRKRGIRFGADAAAETSETTFGYTAWMPGTSPGMTEGDAIAPHFVSYLHR
jgi:hypothetical protein